MPHVSNSGSQDDWFFDTSLKKDYLNGHIKYGDVDHTKQAWVHGLLENVKVRKVLGLSIYVSFLVESVLTFNVLVTRGWFLDDLESSAHFEKGSTGVIVTVPDSLDDSLNFWSLDEVKNLELNSNLERVSVREVLLEHDRCQEVLIIDRLDVLDDHDFNLFHELLTGVTQTEEPLREHEQELIHQAHHQEGICWVREQVSFQSVIEDLLLHNVQVLLDSIEVEDGQQRLRQMELRSQELLVLVALHMSVDGLLGMLEDFVLKSVSEVKHDLISICLDGKIEEVDFEFDIRLLKILKGQSELSAQDKDFDSLGWLQELLVGLQEFDNVSVGEDDLSITV